MPPKKKSKLTLPKSIRQAFAEFGRLGGKVSAGGRWRKLTPEQRTELAKRLAAARWRKKR